MGTNDSYGPPHVTLHSSGFFRDTERLLVKIWNPRFANGALPPQRESLFERTDEGPCALRFKKSYSLIPGGGLVDLERSFQLAKCCYVAMFFPSVWVLNNPMSPGSGCCVFQGRGGLPDHTRCPTPCVLPFSQPPDPQGVLEKMS